MGVAAATAVLLLAGCGGSASSGAASSSSASSSSSPSSSSASSSAVRTIRITVTGKQVTPAPSRVDLAQGEQLRLIVTVDHDDEIHAHGFEIEREATAGRPVTLELTGAEPGLYEVETHEPPLRLLQVLVR